MSEKEVQNIKISVSELRVGHFVDLECSWRDHPFLFSRFKITSQAEIAAIRKMGLTEVTVLPSRSDSVAETTATVSAVEELADASVRQELWSGKEELVERASGYRNERQQAATRYKETVRKITAFSRDLRSAPANAMHAAGEIIDEMAAVFDKDSDVLLNLVNLSDASFTMYSHSLNVAVLSMMLGRQLKLRGEDMRSLGMGALIHDVGKIEIPTQITSKTQPLNASEEALLRTHTTHGAKLAQKLGTLSPAAVSIIAQHHEYEDGSGYPQKLQGNVLSPLVRIVAIANIYDNLCNPVDPARAMSPRDAMAHLFKTYAGKIDRDLIAVFIKAMGVYPPGTVVQLTDDNIGMVVSVDAAQSLRPLVILYNPDIPPKEALMVNLCERPDLQVKAVLKPKQVPERMYEYLGLQERIGYFYKEQKSPAG